MVRRFRKVVNPYALTTSTNVTKVKLCHKYRKRSRPAKVVRRPLHAPNNLEQRDRSDETFQANPCLETQGQSTWSEPELAISPETPRVSEFRTGRGKAPHPSPDEGGFEQARGKHMFKPSCEQTAGFDSTPVKPVAAYDDNNDDIQVQWARESAERLRRNRNRRGSR